MSESRRSATPVPSGAAAVTPGVSSAGASPPAVTSPAVASPLGAGRDAWLDNAKFVLVALVVVGHLLTGIQRHIPAAQVLYLWIFSFHIPAFVFLAGYFSRSRNLGARQLQNVVTRILAPYFIFSLLYAVATILWFGHNRVDLIDPFWLLWFLPALAAWRIVTPLLLNLRWPLLVTILVGLAAGLFPQIGADFALNRVFTLAPFYVLGAVVSRELLQRVRTRAAALAGASLLVVALIGATLVREGFENPKRWLYWNAAYERLDVSDVKGAVIRLALYSIAAVMIFAILAVTPRTKSFVTGLGAASIYIYLLHGFVVKTLQVNGFNDRVTGLPTLALTVVLGVVVAALLGSPPVRRVLRPLVEPRLRWLLRLADGEPQVAQSPNAPAPAPATAGDRGEHLRGR